MRRSHSTLVVAVGLSLGLTAAAVASNHKRPVKAAPPPASTWNWTGLYVGGNFGFGWGDSKTAMSFFDQTGLIGSGNSSFGMDGILGGGQLGYNWQTGNWVWGIEADFQGSGQRATQTFICSVASCPAGAVTDALHQKLEWFGTVRGRIGMVMTPAYLLYLTGGLAYGDVKSTAFVADPTILDFNAIKAGWTIGAGVEGQLVGNWTWKLEYLFMDLGHVAGGGQTSVITSVFCEPPCTLLPAFSSTFTDNILRIGLNYKWP